MRIGITGEQGFIAKNLANEINKQEHQFVSLDNSGYANEYMEFTDSGEVCVYRNTVENWTNLFKNLKLDVIVHNAAVVGTDVVALNPDESTNTNVLGTQKIIQAANNCNMLTVYTGTTVIYDTYKYQESNIQEDSKIYPRTNYAIQKYAGEMFVRNNSNNWLVVRPLFAYGGVGDMNSLIAKSLFGIKNNIKNIDMFLNPEKIKDYMHVEDFCFNVVALINSNIRNEDFNITAANPYNTQEICNMIEEVTGKSLNEHITWHPETDYLGNHRLTNEKFQKFTGLSNCRTLQQGIQESWESIKNEDESGSYNPLKYLEEAKEKDLNLKNYFPKL